MTQASVSISSSLVLPVLQHVSRERLKKAVDALIEGSLAVSLTRQTETEIRAIVKNGKEQAYGVTLTATGAFCSCPDALYRGVTCKHATVLAMLALRQEDLFAQQRFTTGERVQLKSQPEQQGTIVCVSGEVISVKWDTGRTEPRNVAELELLAA